MTRLNPEFERPGTWLSVRPAASRTPERIDHERAAHDRRALPPFAGMLWSMCSTSSAPVHGVLVLQQPQTLSLAGAPPCRYIMVQMEQLRMIKIYR